MLFLSLSSIFIIKWQDIKNYAIKLQKNPMLSKQTDELEIKNILAKEFKTNKNSKFDIRIIRDWAFGNVDGKGFVVRKIDNKWELIPYEKWDQLSEQMPEDIRIKWGEYMNPGD